MWAAVTGDCTLDGDCVQSLNYPMTYGHNQMCTVEINEGFATPIDVISFNVDYWSTDYLTVNGIKYTATDGPIGIVPTTTITWTTDGALEGGGWRLCPGTAVRARWEG